MAAGIRHGKLLPVGALTGTLLLLPRVGHAQEILLTGPLRGASFGHKLYRANRLELGALPGVSLDESGADVLWGLESLYYPTDRFGLGLYLTGATPLTGDAEPALRGFVSPELVAVPFAGMTHPFAEAYFRYDVHFHGGLGRVFAEPTDPAGSDWAVWVGGGVRLVSATFFSNSLDYRLVASEPVRHFVTFSFDWWPTAQHWDDE
jgi:hypothetical protein